MYSRGSGKNDRVNPASLQILPGRTAAQCQ
jgi:hypothetical protein